MYTVTVLDDKRNRVRVKVFPFYHMVNTWLLLNGFLDSVNHITGESVEIKRKGVLV